MDSKKELNTLINQSNLSNWDLSFVERIEAFQKVHGSDFDTRFKCQNQIGVSYHMNEMHQKSLDHLLPLMVFREKIEDLTFANLILNVLDSLTHLDQEDKAKAIFEKYVSDPAFESLFQSEAILVWYVKALNPSEDELKKYESKVEKLSRDLGFISSKKTLNEKVLDLKAVNLQGNQRFSEITIASQNQNRSDTLEEVQLFINSKPPDFYKKMAIDFRNSLLD